MPQETFAGDRQEERPKGPVRRIVVPVAGTDREFLAQEQAVLYAYALGVPLVGVNVSMRPDEVRPDTFEFLHQVSKRRGVAFRSLVLVGTDPVDALVEELDALDLVIVGSERIADRHRLPGVGERLLHDAPCAVQVVRLGPRD